MVNLEAMKRYLFGFKRQPELINLIAGRGAQPNPNIPIRAFNRSDPGLLDRMLNQLTQGGGMMDPEAAYLQGLLSQSYRPKGIDALQGLRTRARQIR